MTMWGPRGAGLVLALALCFLTQGLQAAPDSRGTEFILGYMENELLMKSHENTDIELFVTTVSDRPAEVTVTLPLFNSTFRKTVTVTKGGLKVIKVPHAIRGVGTEKSNKGVLVKSTEEISVYSVNKEYKSTDAYISLPVDVLGTEYYAVTYFSKPELLVVATEDRTTVNITCPVSELNAKKRTCKITYDGVTYNSEETLTLTLDKFETFHALGKTNQVADFTGAHVTSDKPISVISGNKKVSVAVVTKKSADHLTEMMMPVNTWGKTFITTTTPGRSVGDVFRVVASEDETTVTLHNGTELFIEKAGQFREVDLPSAEYQVLTGNKPVMLALFAKTWQGQDRDSATYGDPAMSIIIPEAQYASEYVWSSVRDPMGNEFTNALTVVIDKDRLKGLVLDGSRNIRWNGTKNVLGSSSKVHLVGYVSAGSHTLVHDDPTVTYMALVHGSFKHNSYAYLAGLRLAEINGVCSGTETVMADIVDNDCDGKVDEELLDGKDNDGDGKIDEDLSQLSKMRHTCTVSGDPHLRTFAGKGASIPVPCVYRVAKLLVNDLSDTQVVRFNESLVEVEVLASNGKTPIQGQFFVADLRVKVTLIKVMEGVLKRGSTGTFSVGEAEIEAYRQGLESDVKDKTMTSPWTSDSDPALQDRVTLTYDVAENRAEFSIEGASPWVSFRPVNMSQIRQKQKPGLTLEVGTDQVSDVGVDFPVTLCSRVTDKVQPRRVAERAGVFPHYAGVWAVMEQGLEQTFGDEPLTCSSVISVMEECSARKSSAFTQCSPLLADAPLVHCLQTKVKVAALEVFQHCLNVVCQDSGAACDALKLHAATCPQVAEHVQLSCDAPPRP